MMNAEELKDRTKKFALRIIKFVESLPKTKTVSIIGNQLLRSGTSVGANYRAVCRSRSQAEFISKMGTVIEEADESLYWFEILQESKVLNSYSEIRDEMNNLMNEVNELISIFVASVKSVKNQKS